MRTMHRTHGSLALGLLALATAACGGAAQSAPPAGVDKARTVPVRTATVATRDLDDVVVLTGTLRPRAQVQVVAEVGARLLRILRDEGSRVQPGEVLAVLDPVDFRLGHERAQAALKMAEATLAHAVAEKERADNLVKTGGITDKDHLTTQMNLRVAGASVAQARAEASMAAQQLARSTVRAPFGGRVAKRLADPGAMLAAGTPIFTVVDDSVLEFRAAVPSASYNRVKVGAPVDVSVDAVPGQAIRGRVARIAPLVEERSRSFEAVVEVPGSSQLVGGLFARAVVRVGRVKGAFVLPPTALVRDGAAGDAEAFVVNGSQVERRTVRVGVEGPDAIQITSGLKAGDVVVVDPPPALASGATVEILAARK
jgi:membrane fusion protein, multidrug efflux system